MWVRCGIRVIKRGGGAKIGLGGLKSKCRELKGWKRLFKEKEETLLIVFAEVGIKEHGVALFVFLS